MNTPKLVALLFVASAVAFAQDDVKTLKPYLALGAVLPQGDALDLTQNGAVNLNSWSLEAGFQFFSPFAKVHFRPNIGMAKMSPKENAEPWPYPTLKMLAWYMGADLVFKNPNGWPVYLSTGPSFHFWNVEEAYTKAGQEYGPQALRLGWRGAVGYEITDKWGVEISYSMSEWRTYQNTTEPYRPGLNPSRPVWITIKGVYRY